MASKKRVRPVQKKRLKTTSSSSSSAEDRISRIPDALILHILSFLPTVDAFSTSFLSNRWKRMCSNLLQIRSSSLKFLEIRLHENYDGDWFINMMNFLMNLNCSWNMVTLQVDTAEALIFPKNLKRMFGNLKIVSPFPLVNWDHLRVFTKCKPEKESELRDVLLWIFPSLKTLSIAKGLLKQ
ncbi:hypothetical protein CsatA_002553 [Cannabis sativa]